MMSILQDLDPKYAKIHTQPSFAGWKSITWILSLLIVLLWASWLVYTLQHDKGTAQSIQTANIGPEQGGIKTETTPPQDALRPQDNAVATSPSYVVAKTGSAVIQESQEVAQEKSEKSTEAAPFALIATEQKKPSDSAQMTKPEARERAVQQKNQKANEQPAERKNANKAYADKSSQPGTKKAAERDIDIITAIVR